MLAGVFTKSCVVRWMFGVHRAVDDRIVTDKYAELVCSHCSVLGARVVVRLLAQKVAPRVDDTFLLVSEPDTEFFPLTQINLLADATHPC